MDVHATPGRLKLKPRPSYEQLVKARMRYTLYALAFVYLLLGLRLFYIQVIRASFYQEKANERFTKIPLLARRGTIYDRNGKKLAFTVDAYDIYIHPEKIKDKPAVAAKLAPLIDWNEARLLAKLESRSAFTYLVRKADVDTWLKVKEVNLPGVGANPTTKRVYPGGSLCAHIVGFCNVDGMGMEGLEKAFDKELRGEDGYVKVEMDARRVVIPGSRSERVEAIHGRDIVLTVDSSLQHILETELREMYSARSAVGASAVVMDPKTGEILAIANMPTYDLNQPGKSDADSRRNRAVTDLYEPGSTLKTLTACAALEEGVIGLHDTFYCKGSMVIGRRTVRCSLHPPFMAGHGACDVAKTLKYSCNMGAANMGLKLGKEKLFQYEKAFGLYEKPGTGLPGEISGYAQKWQDWPDVQVANIAFGQGIAVTPVQLTRAYCAIANGGLLMQSHLIKEIRHPDGTPEEIRKPAVVRRVISEETADVVADMLQGVVADGTGKTARVEGYRVAGKTGSAQKASTTGRGYLSGRFIASFVGFLPVSDPRVVILVAVDEPKGTHWGATVAAPVFQPVAREAMWRLKVAPDAHQKPETSVADDVEMPKKPANGSISSRATLRG